MSSKKNPFDVMIWDPVREEWDLFEEWDEYDPKWWFEGIPGAWGNMKHAHFKGYRGRVLHIFTHPALPGRYLARYCGLVTPCEPPPSP